MTDQLLKGASDHLVVFVLTPGLVLLDLAGPAQVFQSANAAGADYRVVHVASSPTVRSDQESILRPPMNGRPWVPRT